jgi:hypothetical protein
MAKRQVLDKNMRVNKSELVRQMLIQSPELGVAGIVKAMNESGHKITPNLVYFLRGKMAGRKARKKRVMRAVKAAVPSANGIAGKTDAITMIREVKALAEKAGGYEKLKELVDALAE